MKIEWKKSGVKLADLDAFVVELLRRLPGCAEADEEAAQKRLYSSPTNGADEEADQDWRENVEPELRELFQSHIEFVKEDLTTLPTEPVEFASLRIPQKNLGAWIHTLNQARLALGAVHNLTDEEIDGKNPPDNSDAAFALLQIDFYGLLLSVLLRHTEL